MGHTSLMRRLLAGTAGLAIAVAGTLALATPAQAQIQAATQAPTLSSVEFENDCDGTLITLNSGTYLDDYEWLIWHIDGEGGLLRDLEPGESDVALAPKGWERIMVTFTDAPADDWPQEWTWEEPADCPGLGDGELPWDLGHWQFDCEVVEITFYNLYAQATATYSFESSTGEVVNATIPDGESATVELASAEGLKVEIRWVEAGGLLATDAIEITSERWDEADCDGESGEGGEGELPLTGTSTALIAAGAVALLALGGGMFLVARRRRVTFTA